MEIIKWVILGTAILGIIYGLIKLLVLLPQETKREYRKIDEEHEKNKAK
jgi:hypothetical protein